MAKTKVLICPYCGDTQPAGERCRSCGGFLEPLSRQATHNAMGPWYIRDEIRPFQPGCSYETLVKLVERGQVTKYTIIRGPTTKQFWTIAKRVPGVAHLLGYCHNCDASVDVGDHGCHACGVPFGAYLDRNYLGLPEVRPLPWEAPSPEEEPNGGVGGPGAPTFGGRSVAGAGRALDFHRAAEPLGISSFASDDELRGSGVNPMSGYGHAVGSTPPAAGGPGPATETAPRAGGVVAAATSPLLAPHFTHPPHVGLQAENAALLADPSADPIAARLAQQQIQQQQRVIRLLTVGLVILALVVVITLLLGNLLRPGTAGSPALRAGSTPASENRSTERGIRSGDSSAATAHDTVGVDGSGTAPPAATSAPATATTTPSTQPATSPAVDFKAEYARAEELLAQARQAERALNDRIRDYEEALKALKGIETSAPTDQKPPDLAEQIRQAQRELDQLRLKAFFP